MVANTGRLKVELDYATGRPTNDKISIKLTSECGYLVRKHAPLQVKTWLQIDKNERERIRDLLQGACFWILEGFPLLQACSCFVTVGMQFFQPYARPWEIKEDFQK